MESILELYKVERVLPDGQLVAVGTFANVQEARKIVEGLSEHWPGDYRIVQNDSPDAEAGLQRHSDFAPRNGAVRRSPASPSSR